MAAPRPYVLLSCAMSVDGYIDDTTSERLRLSDEEDFDRVDQVRAESDAILIGATTLRRQSPSDRQVPSAAGRTRDARASRLPAQGSRHRFRGTSALICGSFIQRATGSSTVPGPWPRSYGTASATWPKWPLSARHSTSGRW
jgi:hypothetical protein